jgi:hypothetical protein
MKYKVGDIVVGNIVVGNIFKIEIISILNNEYEYCLTCRSNKKITKWCTISIDNYTKLDDQYLRKEKLKKLYDTSAVVK